MEADLARVKADWAFRKEKMELEVEKAKVDLSKEKEAEEAIEKYKASEYFTVEKAWVVVDFCKSKEFFANYWGIQSWGL